MNGTAEMSDRKIEYLSGIRSVEDFKAIPEDKLGEVAEEIRSELVRVCSKNGGHLASNLGVVELSMAIHRVFNAPRDHIIFDVGHQCYVHKMLTGRYESIDGIRRAGGISGFPKIKESEYDCFGTGHSSTSLSAALGFAMADKLSGSDAYTVAVVGDGAFTGGMIHEALNNCRKDLHLIIVLNENEMSISRNIGRFAKNLSHLRTSPAYFRTKAKTGKALRRIPLIGKGLFNSLKKTKMFFKNILYGSNYFEDMGLTYLGPINGNKYSSVETLLSEAKKLGESVIVHIKTKKGKGYKPAEASPCEFHSLPAHIPAKRAEMSYSETMGHFLAEMGAINDNICAITAAMSEGTGLEEWKNVFPSRFFDVGIAEGHALTFAAGLAANGMKPCVAIYSTFLQRGYDSIIHDIALQELPVVIMSDRAGLNAADGATHHGIFDVAFFSHIPNVAIYTPISREGLKQSMQAAFALNSPAVIRYPSGHEDSELVAHFYPDGDFTLLGARSDMVDGRSVDAVIVTHGRIVGEAVMAETELCKDGLSVGVILLEMLKPYGNTARRVEDLLPSGVKNILFLEEEIKSGGMGMNLAESMREFLHTNGISYDILAVDDSFEDGIAPGQSVFDAASVGKTAITEKLKRMTAQIKKECR